MYSILSSRAAVLCLLTAATMAASVPAVAAVPKNIVVFGDSLSDTGNLSAYSALTGVILPGAPYAPGRYSNGPLAVEVMASTLGASLHSYAYAGAPTAITDPLVLATYGDFSVHGQITGFISAQHGAPLDANTLYMVWAGANDFNVPAPTLQTALTASANLAADIGRLYAAGARNFFVPTMPDLQYTAGIMAAGAQQQALASALSASFNSALTFGLQSLAAHAPGANIQVFDANVPLNAIRADIAAQGGNVTDPCWTGSSYGAADLAHPGTLCSNPAAYYLWDKVHPSATVTSYVGQAFAAAVVPEPETYALALCGLLTVAVARLGRKRQTPQREGVGKPRLAQASVIRSHPVC
jgi:phospholipase/lecithinase/hemolysin